MKKLFLLGFFVFSFIIGGFVLLINPVMAETIEEGCLANQNYSTTTGHACAREAQFTGFLTETGPSTIMWGSHKITNDGYAVCVTTPCPSALPSYLVSASGSASVLGDLKKYENNKVKIIGQLQWYDLEGGFWGLVATSVIPINVTKDMIQVISPNGGEIYKVGETMNINWSAYKAPVGSWILLEINGGGRLIEQKIETSQGHYSWIIPASFSGYNDYPIDISSGSNYKITAKLLTGINGYCTGMPSNESPCVINPPTLIASDQSDNTFSINNSKGITPNLINRTLRIGHKGEDVKNLQAFIGATVDGSFGPMTKKKVIEWQKANGLNSDGVFGKMSRQKAGFED